MNAKLDSSLAHRTYYRTNDPKGKGDVRLICFELRAPAVGGIIEHETKNKNVTPPRREWSEIICIQITPPEVYLPCFVEESFVREIFSFADDVSLD